MGGGTPGAAAPGAGRAAHPWTLSVGPITASAAATSSTSATNNQDVGVIFQRGVLRSHCIDCLDRTNVAQYAAGLAALGGAVLLHPRFTPS